LRPPPAEPELVTIGLDTSRAPDAGALMFELE
jgi:hypothetical protein